MVASRMIPAVAHALAALGLVLAGCGGGDGLPREPLDGTISLDGNPLPRGMIRFESTVAEPAMEAGTMIEDGRFSLARDEGLVPGSYRVMIYGGPAKTAEVQDGDTGPVAKAPAAARSKELVPARYNAQTTLTAEVKEGGPNSFTFDLKP